MIIAIDFDGTCVTHEFPLVGKDIGAVPVLKRIIANGHSLILWTMRSDIAEVFSEDPDIHKVAGNYLTDAQNWFIQNDIPLWGINANPEQWKWTTSPKVYAHKYIDDAAHGCPLITPADYVFRHLPPLSNRPFVDWGLLEQHLEKEGVLMKIQDEL